MEEEKQGAAGVSAADKSLRRRLIAFGAVAGLVLLIFLIRLAQFMFFS